MKRALLLLGALNLSFAVQAAEVTPPPFSARVRLNVAASDALKSSVTSCLNRELRDLNGVRLIDDKPQWEIDVVALEIRATRGYRGGVAISSVVLRRFNNEVMDRWVRPEARASALSSTSNLWSYEGQYLNMDALDRLQIMCKEIIADFDVKYLEPDRKRHHSFQEHLEKNTAGEKTN